MRTKLLSEGDQRTLALVFDTGDEVVANLERFAQVEVLTLAGDIARQDGKRKVHAHAVLGRRDGSTLGGHLLEAQVRPTLELMLIESPAHLKRVHDPQTGLALIRIDS